MKNVLFVFLFTLASCLETESGGSGSKKRPYSEPYSPRAPLTYQADAYAQEDIPFSFDVKTLIEGSPDLTGYTFSFDGEPSWASLTELASGVIDGVPDAHGLFENVTMTASKPGFQSYQVEFDLAVNGDPLRKLSWHFENTGQSPSNYRGGYDTNSINAIPVYQRGITGKGVQIAVSDSGVEINHDDLYQNSLAGLHKDYTISSPYYSEPTAANFHGTAVTSIIAAKGWNNEGSMGVAPDAKFAGFQFLNSPQYTSILIDQASGDFDIFNYSYGDFITKDTLSNSAYLDHVRYMALNGRGGKGAVYVKSAGNEFYGHGEIGCFSHNANAPYENESPYIIVVGAVNADGERASYSNAGSNIWVSAPGGENARGEGPAIVAADLPTCFKGTSKASSSPWNDFEYGNPLNQYCNYTSTMNGTSSAAPIVSGVVALMLEQNPDLTQREIKHILASTAQQIDPTSNAWPSLNHPSLTLSGCGDYDLDGHQYEQGWVTNGAGYKFHNYYGFGQVDADAAVSAAQSWPEGSLGTLVETNPDFAYTGEKYSSLDTPKAIPDFDKDGVDSVINFASGGGIDPDFVVESAQIRVQVSHDYNGEVGLELTSPSGTKSILLNVNNSFFEPECNSDSCSFDDDLYMVLTSHAFYGESAVGNWTLKAIDGMENDAGVLEGWRLNILGHNPVP